MSENIVRITTQGSDDFVRVMNTLGATYCYGECHVWRKTGPKSNEIKRYSYREQYDFRDPAGWLVNRVSGKPSKKYERYRKEYFNREQSHDWFNVRRIKFSNRTVYVYYRYCATSSFDIVIVFDNAMEAIEAKLKL
jgi:hypothetical protein